MFILAFVSLAAYAQSLTVTGKVIDSEGYEVIGGSVTIKGVAGVGTVTDVNGNYTLKVNDASKDVLVFSYVGMTPQEVKVNNRSVINVTLQADAVLLEDVVVIGYATGSQRTISGAVQKVGREEMNAGVVVNPLAAIKGKIAGVNIQKTGGDPTAAPAIRVRGTTSLTGGNDPLVIIDGVFGDLNMLNAISPADIENFTVLKDASETAQYGSRGASGVIVVTTIKGKNGVKSLSYDGSFGIETVYKNLDMLSASQYRAAAQNLGISILDKGYDTNFIEEMQQSGYTQNHRLSFSNGNEDSNYRASIGVIDQKGIIKNNTMRNYTAKIDAMQNMFNNKLKLEFGMFGSLKENRYVNDYQKTFYSAASYNPTFPNVKNPETGMWDENANANEVHNPLGRLDIDDRETNAFINANARITYSITDDLKLSAFGSYTYNVKENKKYIPTSIKAGLSNRGEAYRGDNKSQSMLANMMLTYKKAFGKHYINALALAEVQRVTNTGFGATVNGFSSDDFLYNNLQAGAVLKWGNNTSYYNNPSLASFMGRVNYSYADKYIVTVNARTDGSSKVGANNKWAFFPSASLAWVLSEEEFMKDIDWLNNLKLRVSFGQSGNDNVGAYQTQGSISGAQYYSFGTNDVIGYVPNNLRNMELGWERTTEYNIGVDFGFLNNRISGSFEYYNRLTEDLIMNKTLPITLGYSSVKANVGSVRNKGFEFVLNTENIRTEDFSWRTSFNIAYNNNKIEKLQYIEDLTSRGKSFEGMKGDYSNLWVVGQPIDINYNLMTIGVWQLDEAEEAAKYGCKPGQYKVLDLDKNGKIDDADRVIDGKRTPDWTGGMVNTFNYKNFDLSVGTSFQLGGRMRNQFYVSYALENNNMNLNNMVKDYWTPENPTNESAQPGNMGTYRSKAGSWGNQE